MHHSHNFSSEFCRHCRSNWYFQSLTSILDGFLEFLILRVNEVDPSQFSCVIQMELFIRPLLHLLPLNDKHAARSPNAAGETQHRSRAVPHVPKLPTTAIAALRFPLCRKVLTEMSTQIQNKPLRAYHVPSDTQQTLSTLHSKMSPVGIHSAPLLTRVAYVDRHLRCQLIPEIHHARRSL